MKIYLDNCCLQRIWDQHIQPRIIAEFQAMRQILTALDCAELNLIVSEASYYEAGKIKNTDAMNFSFEVLDAALRCVQFDAIIRLRAIELQQTGVKSLDALHVACAESGGAEYFITTDDRLQKKLQTIEDCSLRAMNPVSFIEEFFS